MNQYKITVNGVEYDVQVELVNGAGPARKTSAPRYAAPAYRAPMAAPAAPVAAAAPVAPAAPAAAPVVAAAAGQEKISAPMPGNIWKVLTAPGQSVKKGDVLLILEAMKMENEIMAPRDCTVVSVNVTEGVAVESGALLCVIQ